MPNLDSNYYLDKEGLRTFISEFENNVIAEDYDSSATYDLDSYCIHNNTLYKCTTAISTAEAWNSAHWSLVLIGDELKSKMVVLSYGSSTWADFEKAYRQNCIVYCKASSSSDPGYGDQTRRAFMAYVNLTASPKNVEFQYLRSLSSHTDANQMDEVYVYTLKSNNTWSVATRKVSPKIVAGTNMTSTFTTGNSPVITLNADVGISDIPTKTSDLINDSDFVSDASYVHTDNNFTTALKDKLDGVETGAEVNQNAFSTIGVKVDSTTTNVAADSKTDTVTLIQGSNVTLTPDATNDTITIAATDTTYTGTGLISVNSSTHVISTTAEANVQADWNETSSSSDAYIKNKPTIPAAQVNSDWDAVSGVAQILNKPTLGTAAAKDFTTSVTSGSSDLVTSGAVWTAIDNLPEPMVFKGSLGTGGTITTLPTASSANEGYTYKVITAGTYASQAAKVGDVFVSNGTEWVIIPAGDTDSDTWRNIKINGTELLGTAISTGAVNFKNGSNVSITGSGNDITVAATDTTYSSGTGISINASNEINHSNSVTAQTTQKVYPIKIDAQGHISAYGSSPTTLSGYGITDAKIASGVITLGSNTIKSETAVSGGTTASLVTTGEKYTWNNKADASSLSDYVLKAGDTMTGNLTAPDINTTSIIIQDTGNNYVTITDNSISFDGGPNRGSVITSSGGSSYHQRYYIDTYSPDGQGYVAMGLQAENDSSGVSSHYSLDIDYTTDVIYATASYVSLYSDIITLSYSGQITATSYNGYVLGAACAKGVVTTIDTSANLPTSNAVKTFVEGKGYVTTDTKNTAGSTDTSSKIYLIGATSQAANPQTYSDNEVYATSGVLTTKSVQVGGGACSLVYDSTAQAVNFVFS